jgi:hypothetical protein
LLAEMANQEHLDILAEGVKTWNEWRRKNPVAPRDLSGADLRRADLNGAYLNGGRGSSAISPAGIRHSKYIKAFERLLRDLKAQSRGRVPA